MRRLAILLLVLGFAVPALAADDTGPEQGRAAAPPARRPPPKRTAYDEAPTVSLRPFFLLTGQQFAASKTFDAVFGGAFQPFYGGGLELSMRNGLFVDASASYFSKTGQRAFFFNGQASQLGIPLKATIVPFELTAGYRFLHVSRTVIPYAGVGYASYGYKETSGFSDPSENVDTRHGGYLVVGGAEFRAGTWVGVSGDVQYTHVTGILGSGGVSQQAGESNLGGVAARVRVIVGR